MRFFFSVTAPYRWAQIDRRGQMFDRGTADTVASLPIPSKVSELIAVVPGDSVTCHSIKIPSRNRKKVMAAIPYALEDTLSEDFERLHFALLRWQPNEEALVAVVAKQQMEDWMLDLEGINKLKIDAVVPDYLLLPLHNQADCTMARTEGGRMSIRKRNEGGMGIDEEAIPYWWAELDNVETAVAVNDQALAQQLVELDGHNISHWSIGEEFTSWLKHHDVVGEFPNLRQGLYAPKHRQKFRQQLRPAAVILLAALFLKLGLDGWEYFSLASQSRQIDTAIQEIFQKTFPKARLVAGRERVVFEQKLNAARGKYAVQGEFQRLLSAVARVVPKSAAQVTEITFRDNVLVVTCTTREFAGLDRIKKLFEQDDRVQVKLLSSGSRENQVSGRFQLRSSG